LEAQLKDLETQLNYGWQAYEGQGQQLTAMTAQYEQSKQQADYHQQWSQYWQSEFEKLSTSIAEKENNTPVAVPVQQQQNSANEEELTSMVNELTNLRKEQEDLLVLCADQDQKLKEYRRVLKEHGLLAPGQVSDDEEDEEQDDEGEEDDVEGQQHNVSYNRTNPQDDVGALYHASRIWNAQQPIGHFESGAAVAGARTSGDGDDYYNLR